ncbi:type II secretion system minor pseudopilin GspJ [Reinekea sp.]|jgi:general secretion pathway protein J|uniref:type II secretion system minor pseudopilin GspJ n=1 Tax=Reinekea sp. TaxID=1970455 RepID=UPI0039892B7A
MTHQKGLTLIELLIAMAISAIIAVVSFRLFSISVDTKKNVEAQSNLFTELARTMRVIERDFSQLAPYRKVRTPYGEYNEFLTLDFEGLQLTRNGWAVSPYQTYQRSTLQRVQYRLAPRGSELCAYSSTNETLNTPCLVRSFTVQLDDDGSLQWRHQILSEHISSLEWLFLVVDETTGEGQLVSELPENYDPAISVPLQVKAVEINIELDDGREFKRLISTPMQIGTQQSEAPNG